MNLLEGREKEGEGKEEKGKEGGRENEREREEKRIGKLNICIEGNI